MPRLFGKPKSAISSGDGDRGEQRKLRSDSSGTHFRHRRGSSSVPKGKRQSGLSRRREGAEGGGEKKGEGIERKPSSSVTIDHQDFSSTVKGTGEGREGEEVRAGGLQQGLFSQADEEADERGEGEEGSSQFRKRSDGPSSLVADNGRVQQKENEEEVSLISAG